MANTFTQLYFHVVFSTKDRRPMIQQEWESKFYHYISGIGYGKKQKVLLVNGHKDHIHILLSLNPSVSLSDVIRDIKSNSSRYINDKGLSKTKFACQEGYGAFSCSK